MTKWLIPLLLSLTIVCFILFHIILPLHNGIQINTPDAYYMLRYADTWPNIPAHDYFFNYPEGAAPMHQMIFPAMIAMTARLFHIDTTTAGAVIPPVLFLLTLIPVYIITRVLFKDKLIAAISVFMLAIMPGEILHRTMLGAADYHCLEILLVTTTMMFAILAIKNIKRKRIKWLFTYVLLAGIFIKFYIASWPGAAQGAAAILSSSSSGIFSIASLFIPNLTSTVSETTPLFFTNGQFDIGVVIVYFSITFFLALFGIGVLLHQYIKNKETQLLLFLVWTVGMLALTFSMRRFAYYSAINIAVIASFASVYIVKLFKANKVNMFRIIALLIITIPLVFGYRSTVTALSGYGTMPIAWQECCTWLRAQSDDSYYTGADPGYGVLSHWNYGYWIAQAGHTPAYGTPGHWFGNDILCNTELPTKWRYIILDEEMFIENAYSIFYANGVEPSDTAVYKLFYFSAPIWQSTDSKVKVFETKASNNFYGLTLINNSQAKDVSSIELMTFLQQDKTNEHDIVIYNAPADRTLEELVNSGYMCANFAVDLHNNAEKAGIRCAIVVSSEQYHAFNAFQLTDGELVFVDASSGYDTLIEPIKSKSNKGYILTAYSKIRQGIGDTCIIMLGNPEQFKIKW